MPCTTWMTAGLAPASPGLHSTAASGAEVFQRFWCAVEIVNAWKNSVPIILLAVDEPAAAELGQDNFLEAVMGQWSQAIAC